MLISISGVDCAGKSTQIELLRQHFISLGKTCTVFWYRPGYSVEMQDVKKVVRLLMNSACWMKGGFDLWLHKDKPLDTKANDQNSASSQSVKIPAPLWLSTAILDTAIQWGLKLRYLCRKYDVVICDRYVEDARLDLMLKYPQFTWTESVMQSIAKVLPKPDFAFLLWISADEMIQRAQIKQEPFPDDEHTRQMRYRAYEFIADQDHITLVDASCTVEETHRKIIEYLGQSQQESPCQ